MSAQNAKRGEKAARAAQTIRIAPARSNAWRAWISVVRAARASLATCSSGPSCDGCFSSSRRIGRIAVLPSSPRVARRGLGSAFVEPALRMLQYGGAQIRLNSRLDAFEFGAHGNAVDAVSIGGERIDLAPGDAVVLAVPPEVAQPLVPELAAPDTFSAVVTAYFAVEASAGHPLQTTVVNGVVDAVRSGDGQLAATIRDAGRWLDMPRDTLARRIWEDVARVTGANPETIPAWQLVVEPRAGFAAVPSQEMKRPAVRTRWTNLVLAGDWIATGLPATIEGAIRSGQLAADVLQTQ
ncbi:amine oxidase (flavin-containing) domain protein [Burkholderia cenocepacia BC7]|nr:amine oxidase (flavin-containing) domain protein [Burkholderia cenocepacia BC7]